ncbi:hypothetical protein N752_05255 [Desulforamulus aquiferis]|nr:6-hydroxymethylpterin diphosphokinase MptE-like protein [Desulforamulus aquiferis]RYD06301.1 hypothetical protein N752_05255 [Desulforamulus aquiferis]
MKIIDKNIQALKEKKYDFVEDLLAIKDVDNNENIRVLQSPMGHYVMYKKNPEGHYLQINSMYDPSEEANYTVRKLPKDMVRRIVIVIGVGMGYHLREVVKRINEKSVVIIIENNIDMLYHLLHHEDLTEEINSKNVSFIVGNKEKISIEVCRVVSSFTFNLNDILIITLPIMDLEYLKFCRLISQSIELQKTNKIFMMGNDTEDSLIGIRNNFLNCGELLKSPGIDELLSIAGDIYKNKPAVIVASGPSLNKNIHLLKEIQDKALIIACDGSLSLLQENGIEPHVVSSVERIFKTYQAFYENKKIPPNTVLMTIPVIRKEIFQCFKDNRKIVSIRKGEGINEWMSKVVPQKGKINAGTSVAHLCFSFAQAVGADPIILVGQDLAYSSGGYSHAEGVEIRERIINNKNTVYVKDYDGNNIPSTYVWRNFLASLSCILTNAMHFVLMLPKVGLI